MKLPKSLGTVAFWLTWPALWIYLKNSKRTRVIITYRGEVLLIKAWLGTSDWALPGGGRHRNETAEAAGIREVMEETGIDINTCEKRELFTDRAINELGFSFTHSCYVAELQKKPKTALQRSEVVKAIWASQKQLQSLKLSKASKACLEAWSDSLDLIH